MINKYAYFLCCSNLQGITSFARRDGSDWILNGSKSYVINGHSCDVLVVLAVTDAADPSQIWSTLFIVDPRAPGVIRGPKLQKIGLQDLVSIL